MVRCPTLIVGAELDNFAPLYMSKELNAKIFGSDLKIVSMAGHFGLSQRFQEYNNMMSHFLNKQALLP